MFASGPSRISSQSFAAAFVTACVDGGSLCRCQRLMGRLTSLHGNTTGVVCRPFVLEHAGASPSLWYSAGVTSLAWSPCGTRLFVGSSDKCVRVWDTCEWQSESYRDFAAPCNVRLISPNPVPHPSCSAHVCHETVLTVVSLLLPLLFCPPRLSSSLSGAERLLEPRWAGGHLFPEGKG